MTLTLRLKGPYQRWGAPSHFTERRTNTKPTKRGIIGLIMAAHGVRREDQAKWLSDHEREVETIKMSVETLSANVAIVKDFQMVHGTMRAEGKPNKYGVLTNRYYLQDADFRVILSGDQQFLTKAKAALSDPKFPLFLGSKTCIPSMPILERD